MKLNSKLRNILRKNRFEPLEQDFNHRICHLFKEVGAQLRNSKERKNVKVLCHGPKTQKMQKIKQS